MEDALQGAEQFGDDFAVVLARFTLGLALLHRDTAADRDGGQKLLAEARDVFLSQRRNLGELPIVDMYVARERARRGDPDEAIPLIRTAVDHLFRDGALTWGTRGMGVLVETLLDRGTHADVTEAEAAIKRLATAPTHGGTAPHDVLLLRLQALLTRARGDESAYRDLRDRYRANARSLGFEGHIAWAEAMP
jgi:hypothetical protein